MAKLTALGMTLNVDDASGTPVNITDDVGSMTFNTPRAVIDVSGLDVIGYQRLIGRSDITMTLNGFYNPAVSHTVLKTVPTQAGTVTRTVTATFPSGGTVTAEMVAVDYNLSINADGAMPWTASFQAANGSAAAWS